MSWGWGTRWGFYFAAIGSAFGLANLWRFPYVVGTSGGGAFVLIYLLTILLVGLPVLVAELMMGKFHRKGIVGALSEMQGPEASPVMVKTARWTGRLSLALSVALLSYYAIVSGWVLHFFVQYGIGLFKPVSHSQAFRSLQANGGLQMTLGLLHLLLCRQVVKRGLRRGLEQTMGYVIPIFGVLLIYLIFQSMGLSGNIEALRFFFYPDVTEISFNTVNRAVGHAFWTLGLGCGMMVVFGSYMRDETSVSLASLRVAFVNSLISLCAGLLIFPIVFTGGLRVDAGPTLLFETIPLLLSKTGLGDFFGLAFFACLYLSSLGASLGLFEVGVANFTEKEGWGRRKSTTGVVILAFVMALVPAFSGALELWDALITHFLLPLVVLVEVSIFARSFKLKAMRSLFLWDNRESTQRLFRDWVVVVRWGVPILVLGALLAQVLEVFLRN